MSSGSSAATGGSSVTGGITSSGTSGTNFDSGITDSGVSSSTYTPPLSGSDFSGGTDSGESSESGGAADKAKETATQAKDKAMGAATQAKDKATEFAGTAKEKLGGASQSVDQQRDTVAGGLDTVASTLRDRAETLPGGEKTTQIAQNAAEKLDSASGYLRDNEVSDMMTDVERFVRAHPTESLVIGAAAGFLIGRMFKG